MSSINKIWPNPLHCFLIPVFFLVHNYIDFYGLIDFKSIRPEVFLWLLFPFILFSFFNFLFRNKSNAGFYSSLLLLIYYFSVPLQQLLKRIPVIGEWVKLTVFIGILFLLLLALFFLFKKNRFTIKINTHLYLSLVFCFLIVYDVAAFLVSNKADLKMKNRIAVTDSVQLKTNASGTENLKPDIYFFLFDMHGSTAVINETFHYNNSLLDDSLRKMDFVVTEKSTSATNYTPTSLFSIFNMTALPYSDHKTATFREMYKARNSIRLNPVVPFLQIQGYQIINASNFPIFKNDTSYLHHVGWGHPEELVLNQTLFHHLYKTFYWVLIKFFPNSFKGFRYEIYRDDILTIHNALARTENAIALKDTATPKFVYTHLYIPHPPYKFDSLGNRISWEKQLLPTANSDSLFISQLKYCRLLITDLAMKIKKKNARPAIIIFQGDHGARDETYPEKTVFQVLNAISFPKQATMELSTDFYTPNTFRLILNQYFGQQLLMLTPKHFFITLN